MTSTMMSSVSIPVPGDTGNDEKDANRAGHVVGTLLMPAAAPTGFLTIHPAVATPAGFYTTFAEYAAESGLAVLTYDPRGVAASGPAREYPQLRMSDWMQQDATAVASWARSEFPALPKVALGHSLGGHALLLGDASQDLHGIVTVASHRAALRDMAPPAERLRVGFILTVLGPLLSPIVGYAPGKRLGLGEDIPLAAMLEWARWARMPEYFFDDPRLGAAAKFARLRTPVLAVSASDDPWASPAQVDALLDYLRLAEVERCAYTPQDLEVPQIGHHGLLRRSVGNRAWPDIVSWLIDRLPRT